MHRETEEQAVQKVLAHLQELGDMGHVGIAAPGVGEAKRYLEMVIAAGQEGEFREVNLSALTATHRSGGTLFASSTQYRARWAGPQHSMTWMIFTKEEAALLDTLSNIHLGRRLIPRDAIESVREGRERDEDTTDFTKFQGQLEIDPARGVVYFHDEDSGHTILRIQALPRPVPTPNATPVEASYMLDIHFGDMVTGHKTSWEGRIR